MTSRRTSRALISVLAAGAAVSMAAGAVSATTVPSTEAPAESTEAPGTTEASESTEAPGTTEASESTEAPGTTEASESTEAPAATDAPAAGGAEVGTVGGSGCGIPHGPYDDPGVEPSGEVRVAWNDPLLSFNTETGRGNAAANANPLYLMNFGEGFTYYDGDLNLTNNDQFGTCVIESLDPLSITYRINEGVTWSDGVQVDAADLLLYWAAVSGVYNSADAAIDSATGRTIALDAEGKRVVVDPDGNEYDSSAPEYADAWVLNDAGEPTTALNEGWDYVDTVSVRFDASSESLSKVTELPVISDDGLAVTATWDEFYVDYQTAGLITAVPAHTTARLALGIDDPAAAKAALIDAFTTNDTDAVKAISEVYNTGYDATSLPDDPGVYLGHGPYLLTEYTELSQMVFEANPDYTWGPRPKVQTIVYQIIGVPEAAVQELENESIDVIQPQATADILTQVNALSERGIEVLTGDTGTYEHVDLVFDNDGPFGAAAYDGNEETAKLVRQAFLKTIPRQEIVDRLIVPLNPNAALRNSFTQVPGSPDYDAIVEANRQPELYGEVDIEGAIALLEEAGVETPVDVRFLFAANNPRRLNQYELIRDSAAQAGFNVIDGSSPTWGPDLNNTDIYDASLFGWQSTAVDIAGSNANFVTGGQNNYGGYSSEIVDGLYAELQSNTDTSGAAELLGQIEAQLIEDAFGITLFQHPAVTAYNANYVSGIDPITLSPTYFWNVFDWEAL